MANTKKRMEWLLTCTGKQLAEYQQSVRDLGCIVCGYHQADFHHLRGHGYPRKRQHCPGIPLCHHNHHQGDNGIHNGRKTFECQYGRVEDMLTLTEERLNGKETAKHTEK